MTQDWRTDVSVSHTNTASQPLGQVAGQLWKEMPQPRRCLCAVGKTKVQKIGRQAVGVEESELDVAERVCRCSCGEGAPAVGQGCRRYPRAPHPQVQGTPLWEDSPAQGHSPGADPRFLEAFKGSEIQTKKKTGKKYILHLTSFSQIFTCSCKSMMFWTWYLTPLGAQLCPSDFKCGGHRIYCPNWGSFDSKGSSL